MSNPKKQHYVPQCYLREFVCQSFLKPQDAFVWIFDKNGKNRRKDKIKNVLASNHIYTLKIKGVTKDYSIEKALANIEGEYAEIFRNKIKKNLPLTEYEHIILCFFVAAMLQRTLRKKDSHNKFIDDLISRGEVLAKQHGAESEQVKYWKENKENLHNINMMELLPDLTKLLVKMKLAFLCTSTLKGKFITSDDPCVLFNPDLQGQRYWGPGLAQKSIQLTIPLSSKICLCLSWQNLLGYINISKNQVEDLNRLTRAHCYKYFVSSSKNTKLIWFSRYPLNLFFIIKIIIYKIRERLRRTMYNIKYKRNVRKK